MIKNTIRLNRIGFPFRWNSYIQLLRTLILTCLLQSKIHESAYEHAKLVDNERRIIVGVNKHQQEKFEVPELLKIEDSVAEDQINRLKEVRRNRDQNIVDNTLSTPFLFKPIEHGADIVIHSTTKYLNGHGSANGGIIIDAGKFNWPEDKYPDFKTFKERKGDYAYIDKVWREIHINFGTTQSPFQSYLTLIGLDPPTRSISPY